MFVVGGESLVDMLPTGRVIAGGGIEREALAGGSPFNCAIALAKLGAPTGFLCPISADEYGDMLLAPLQAAKVQLLLPERVAAPTTKAIITYDENRDARYRFERGADHAFSREQLIAALPERVELFQIGGFCPIEAVDAEIWLEVAREAAARGAMLSMDPNVRPQGLDFAGYTARLSRFLDLVSVVKVSVEDVAALERQREVKRSELTDEETEALVVKYVGRLLDRPNIELVVVTDGDKGSWAFTRTASAKAGIFRARQLGNTVGAGDCMMAGVLTWLGEHDALKPGRPAALDGVALGEMLRFGAVVAGLNCEHIGCVPPTRAEVDAVLAAG